MITTTEMELVSVEKLVPYINNARTHSPEQVNKLRASIREFGFINPVIIDRNYGVIAGHGRILAAKEEGITEVPCVFADHLSEAQKKAYIIADNRMAMDAGWDEELLRVEIESLAAADFNTLLTGFDEEELARLFADDKEAEEDDFEPEPEDDTPAFTQKGDIWTLGRHRLICGDSTKPETFSALLEGKQADLVITDPPYNVDYNQKTSFLESQGRGKTKRSIQNDCMDEESFYQFLFDFYSATKDVMREGAAIYVFHSDVHGLTFRKAFEDAGLRMSECLIWKKSSLVLGRSDYQWIHEPCLYGWKEGAKHYFTDDRTQTTVLEEHKPKDNDLHPTMKPVPLIGRLVKNSSHPDWSVLDPFGGSGSTLIACEQTDRICYTVELDEKYCDVIVRRYIEQVGTDENVSVLRDGVTLKYKEVEAAHE